MSDIERSLEFGHDAFGLALVARQSQERGYHRGAITQEPGAHVHQAHLRFPSSDDVIELLQRVALQGEPRMVLPRPRRRAFGVTCEDLPMLLARLETAGGRRFADPVALDRGIFAGAVVVNIVIPTSTSPNSWSLPLA